jgi:hypothetical protein
MTVYCQNREKEAIIGFCFVGYFASDGWKHVSFFLKLISPVRRQTQGYLFLFSLLNANSFQVTNVHSKIRPYLIFCFGSKLAILMNNS